MPFFRVDIHFLSDPIVNNICILKNYNKRLKSSVYQYSAKQASQGDLYMFQKTVFNSLFDILVLYSGIQYFWQLV